MATNNAINTGTPGTAITKNATDNTKTSVASVTGAFTVGHQLIAADISGTISDGGPVTNGTVTSVTGAGIANGTVTTFGNITVTAAVKADQTTGTSTTVAVVPGVQQFHDSSTKFWANWVGTTGAINGSYNVSSVSRTGTGSYTVNFTTSFANTNFAAAGAHTNNAGNASSMAIHSMATGSVSCITNVGGAVADPTTVYILGSGRQ